MLLLRPTYILFSRLFLGTTREIFDGRKVAELKYEAYRPMAQHELIKICNVIRKRWDVINICIIHRLGFVSHSMTPL